MIEALIIQAMPCSKTVSKGTDWNCHPGQLLAIQHLAQEGVGCLRHVSKGFKRIICYVTHILDIYAKFTQCKRDSYYIQKNTSTVRI